MTLPVKISLVASLLVYFVGDVAQAQQTYPLLCNLRTESTSFLQSGFIFKFRHANYGYETRVPMVGHCAWRDRGFRDGEPKSVSWIVDETVFGSVVVNHMGEIQEIWEVSGRDSRDRQRMSLFVGSWRERSMLIFQVYRDKNTLKVTNIREYRP